MGSPDKVRLVDLEPYAQSGGVQVAAHGTNQGKLATGITFTAIGGMAVITGLALTPIGCGSG